MVAAYVGHTFS